MILWNLVYFIDFATNPQKMKKIFLMALFASTLLASCHFLGGKRVRGNGNIKTEERSVSPFSKVEVHGNIDVYVIQGDAKSAQNLRIEGDENLIPYVEISQEGDELIVRNRSGYNLR